MVGSRDPVICTGHQELRDIVVETRSDVKYIKESVDKTNSCIHDHDTRIRTIEITGSKKAEEALQAVNDIVPRISSLEKLCSSDGAVLNAKKHWTETMWARAFGVIGILLGVAAFIKELL